MRTWIDTHLFHVLLLSPGEIQHVIGIFDQNSALRFRLCNVNGVREDCDLRFCDFFHIACPGWDVSASVTEC